MKYSLFAILGFPLEHSLSPAMHHRAFQCLGMKASYFPLPVPPAKIRIFLRNLRQLPIDGCNVTVPYKQLALEWMDHLDRASEVIGAVNTIKKTGCVLWGYNTDWIGFVEALWRDLRFSLAQKNVLLIGAGGAARACLFAALQEKVRKVVLCNRSLEKVPPLLQHFRPFFANASMEGVPFENLLSKDFLEQFDLIVNTTSVGLKPGDSSLIPIRYLPQKKTCLYDLIYNPAETPFLLSGRKRGLNVANGLTMLLYQGTRAFEIWTEERAPIVEMKKALLGH